MQMCFIINIVSNINRFLFSKKEICLCFIMWDKFHVNALHKTCFYVVLFIKFITRSLFEYEYSLILIKNNAFKCWVTYDLEFILNAEFNFFFFLFVGTSFFLSWFAINLTHNNYLFYCCTRIQFIFNHFYQLIRINYFLLNLQCYDRESGSW